MADIKPPPIEHPVQDPNGLMHPAWVRWFKDLERIIRGLS